ncbi:YbaN family protein [Emcibacter sp.]|uniref:YbaN family protein n=1 Tax=Emcibacter sp. TaxID=1979954 RepID=UPI002AA7D8C1|nr:YbaN family protein [Emcibacter sp.]
MIARTKRWIYNLLGAVFFITGFIGIFLPVLPTTVFMILALWAFSNGSEQFHQWLYHHPTFGPPLQAWEERGVIPLKGKIMAVLVMSLSALYLVFLTAAPVYAVIAAIICMICVAVFVVTRPSS